jgi:hypothetical protein
MNSSTVSEHQNQIQVVAQTAHPQIAMPIVEVPLLFNSLFGGWTILLI